MLKSAVDPLTHTTISRKQIVFQFLVLVLLLLLLVNYTGTAGLKKIQQVRETGTLNLVQLHPKSGSTLTRATSYLHIVWPALLFGVLIVRAVLWDNGKILRAGMAYLKTARLSALFFAVWAGALPT